MFDFGIGYCYRLYNQIKNIYNIKTYLDILYKDFEKDFEKDENNIIQIKNFESLKQIIFSCGSLYIKFFQWYISKIKSSIIDINQDVIDLSTVLDSETSQCNIINSKKTDVYIKNLTSFITYFEDIFEQCPYHDIKHTKEIFIDSMYGISLETYIDIKTLKPIASGSIGQVYYARRRRDNIEIAIKVKHPRIEEDLQNQYELIKLIKLIQSISYFRNRYNMYYNIDDFLSDINLQCDFNNEADNCKTFQENFKDSSKYIVFPKIIYQSKNILISEYIEGDSFENLSDIQKYQTTTNFICFFYQMLLVDNFIHGDLHCKNWKVRINKDNTKDTTNTNIQIIVYDCGICFQNTSVELTNNFWFALFKYDIENINKTLKEFIIDYNIHTTNIATTITTTNINYKNFEKDINKFFYNVLNHSAEASIIIKSILFFFRSNNIIVHKFLLNISILLCVIEEFLKANNIINKNKLNNNTSMFEIMNDCQLDIIAFCDVKKCYPKVRDLFTFHMKDKYINYKTNIEKHNINEITNTNKQLFSSLSLSSLKFKPPE